MLEAAQAEQVLAFDFGLKHIGVAYGQSVTDTASAVTTLAARSGKPKQTELTELIRLWQPNRLLVGLPLNMDDSESDISAGARAFAALLERVTGLPVTLVDERLSSIEANQRLGGASKDNHAMAAVVIAESYFAERPSPEH